MAGLVPAMLFVRQAHVLVASALAACATFQNPPPPGAEVPRVVLSDGTGIPLRQWLPPGVARGVVVALHGFTDYSGAFNAAAAAWSAQGFAVYAYDQRGFGATDTAGLWAGPATMIADMKEMTARLRARHPGAPLFLLGESMGAAVLINALGDPDFPANDGIVMVAPAVWGWRTLPPMAGAALRFFARLLPAVGFGAGSSGSMASDNDEMRRAMAQDPLVLHTVRLDMVVGLVDLMDQALSGAGRVPPGTLVLYGARDGIIPPRAREQFRAGLDPGVDVRVYAEGYHMLLRDRQADRVIADVADWLERRIAR